MKNIKAHDVDASSPYSYVVDRYDRAIGYYWRSSAGNKHAFKWTRLATIVLGSVVTLLASLASSDFLGPSSDWAIMTQLGTPVLAALLTVLTALAQTFQWEAAWRESVMTAERLAKELDRIRVSDPAAIEASKELERMNDFILHESESFFDRILGRSQPPVDGD